MAHSMTELRRLLEKRKGKPGYKLNVEAIEAQIKKLER